MPSPVYLEIGTKRVFAGAVDWPGRCRAAKNEDAALESLAAYAERYRPVTEAAGMRFPASAADTFHVVERVKGDATTDFGAPSMPIAGDATPLAKAQGERLAALVDATWTVFDRVVEGSPAELRQAPGAVGATAPRWWPTWSTPRPRIYPRWA